MTAVGDVNPFVAQRRAQGWLINLVVPAGVREQVVEAHCTEPSVVSITVQPRPGKSGALADAAGRMIIETRIGEAKRTRVVPTRFAGTSTNVPSGVTRVFFESLTAAEVTLSVQIAPGIATVEHVAVWETIAGGATTSFAPVPFARTVTVGPTSVAVNVSTPASAPLALQPPGVGPTNGCNAMTLPALAALTITNPGANAAELVLNYEIES